MVRCQGLAVRPSAIPRVKACAHWGADETLEYGCRDGYMLYEPTFSERKRAPKETYAEILFLVP
jgi:hypothetical protein